MGRMRSRMACRLRQDHSVRNRLACIETRYVRHSGPLASCAVGIGCGLWGRRALPQRETNRRVVPPVPRSPHGSLGQASGSARDHPSVAGAIFLETTSSRSPRSIPACCRRSPRRQDHARGFRVFETLLLLLWVVAPAITCVDERTIAASPFMNFEVSSWHLSSVQAGCSFRQLSGVLSGGRETGRS